MMGYIKTKEEIIEQVQAKITDLETQIKIIRLNSREVSAQYEIALSNLYIALTKLYENR